MNEDKWKFTIDKLVPAEEIINNIEEYHYIDAYLGYEDDFQIDSILYYLKAYQQLKEVIEEVREYIKEWQHFPHTNCTTHNELKNLLQILDKGVKDE